MGEVYRAVRKVMTRIDLPMVLVLLCILAVGAFYLSTIREGHPVGGDNSMYILHAKNIVEGTHYRDTGFIYNPSSNLFPESYPPVFPFLLAPVYKWFGLNLTAMKVEVIFSFLLGLWFIALNFYKTIPTRYMAAAVAVVGLNPVLWRFKDSILSEFPFFFFICLSSYFISRAYQPHSSSRRQFLYAVLIGFSIYLSYGTRAVGFLLLPSLFVYDLQKFKKPSRLAILVVLLFIPLLVLQNLFLHSERSHFVSKASTVSFELVSNNFLHEYPVRLASFWSNGYFPVLAIILALTLSGLAILGLVVRLRKKQFEVVDIFFLMYLVFFLAVPFGDTTPPQRYLIPVVPFYIFYVFVGASSLKIFQGSEYGKVAFMILLGLIFTSYTARYTTMDFNVVPDGITSKPAREMYDFIKQNTSENDVVMFVEAPTLVLYTGRRTSEYFAATNQKDLMDHFRKIQASYWVRRGELLMVYKEAFHFLVLRDNLEPVFSNSKYHVYRIVDQPLKPMEHVMESVISPFFAQAHNNLGAVLLEEGRVDEAMEHFSQAVEINLRFFESLKDRAPELLTEVFYAVENNLRTVESQENLPAMPPTNIFYNLHDNLGVAFMAIGELDKAIGHFQRAVDYDSNNPDAYTNMGLALAKKGRLEEAARHLFEAIGVGPDFAPAYYYLAMVRTSQGRTQEAIDNYRKTLELKPDYEAARQRLNQLLSQTRSQRNR